MIAKEVIQKRQALLEDIELAHGSRLTGELCLQWLGVGLPYLRKVESGKATGLANVPCSRLADLCSAYGISPKRAVAFLNPADRGFEPHRRRLLEYVNRPFQKLARGRVDDVGTQLYRLGREPIPLGARLELRASGGRTNTIGRLALFSVGEGPYLPSLLIGLGSSVGPESVPLEVGVSELRRLPELLLNS